jgi:uncharacterized protein
MDRRNFFRLIVAGLGTGAVLPAAASSTESGEPSTSSPTLANPSVAAGGNYPNNRAPLLQTKFVRLPLGAIRPQGWILDQLNVQSNGLTSHLGEVWETARVSAWKGDLGKNVTPECCVPRFVPRWLEGLTTLSGVLHDDHLKSLTDPYMQHILSVSELPSTSPSLCAWSHVGRFMPDYFELTGDPRAIKLIRKILDYADSVRNSQDGTVVEPARLGMLLSFGYWYYNHTGDSDVPALLERCSRPCVDDWKNYFVTFPTDPKYFVHFPDQTTEKPNEPTPDWTRQGVDTTQAIQYPMQHYLLSGDKSDIDSVLTGIANLDKGYGQIGGRWSGDEWLASTDPTQGTELCDIEELLFSLEKGFEILGEAAFADRIEQLIFNSFPGTCMPDMWAHQYDQQSNQVLVSVAHRHWHWNDDSAGIYGFAPNLPCCLANMHSPWPRFVQSMWMSTADKGLVAATYSPCRISAHVGDGSSVELIEETDYPFSDRIRITVNTKQPVSFPIYFRIPVWSQEATLQLPGSSVPVRAKGGAFFKHTYGESFIKIDRLWKPGDVVNLAFNFKVRTETRKNNAVAIAWGPLYFVLRIGESFQRIPPQGLDIGSKDTPAPPGCVDWQITPTTDWNYALAIDRNNPQCAITTSKISSMPFAQKGEFVKRPGATDFAPWQDDVPMILHVKARKVPHWVMAGASADEVPSSPVHTDAPETLVELIPYGCSRLRIAEFPTV